MPCPEHYLVGGADSTSSWVIIGDDVNNFIGGGDVDDQIEGRAGHDSLYGSTGKDRLYADTVIGVAAAIEAAKPEPLQSADYAELLDGGGGDDLLIGGTANYLLGGGGSDTIIGYGKPRLPGQYHGNDYLDGGDGSYIRHANGNTFRICRIFCKRSSNEPFWRETANDEKCKPQYERKVA